MSVANPANENQNQSDAKTFGDLLYANKARVAMSEKDWVSLVESIAAGDQQALYSVYKLTDRIVFTLILRITRNLETAEEVTLDVFHDVWRKASTYEPASGSVLGWIMNQARSRAIDRLRFLQRKKRINNKPDTPLRATPEHDPQEAYERAQQRRLLHDALAVLNPEERQVIETAFFSELTYQETAARLNQPLGTVKTRVRSGLGKLRRALAAGLKVE